MQATFTFPKDEPVIRIERTFDAPRDLVWRAMTDPKLIVNWWGPRRFTTEVKQHDFRVGGKWRFANKGADGAHEFFGEYREIVAPEKVVQTFCFMDFPPAIETMTLEDGGDQTHMVMVSRFPDIAHRDGMAASGMESGARETYERLDETLASLKGNASAPLVGRELHLTRLIDAPRELVWKAWTDPKFVAAWWGPLAYSAPVCELDVRVGGKLRIVMSNPALGDHDVNGEFKEVRAPAFLSFTAAVFPDADGAPKVVSLTELSFELEDGKTRMTLRAKMLSVTPDMAHAVDGWPVGWGQSLDKLEALVATMRMV